MMSNINVLEKMIREIKEDIELIKPNLLSSDLKLKIRANDGIRYAMMEIEEAQRMLDKEKLSLVSD